jgi:NAD(P)H-dependent flavin oxidoreductase YrpB (nitropropane dioxygenase family)
MFGLEAPIVAFSHCRDVVVEVSRAGGMGVLGTARASPERLREELAWIDAHIDGRPYGLDVLMPMTYADAGENKFNAEVLFLFE